ncbi:peptidase a24a prepilin type iv bacterial [Lucifera butyrica]|uniref:Prepilin leader peptidase/N-methyltransferase n=1 Tax=Lucifera butyrica TaxID=1351585 RepID=A0A498R7K0_9FIRM|nr:peptidase a24a prepilin type iv bacterial [Lucifera butyrica]
MQYFLIVLFGLLIGSFLNVCIYRLPRGESLLFPPSHCMSCSRRLKPLDLIPVVSFILLGGKCRYCGTPFSSRYIVVELLTACLYIGCLLIFGLSAGLIRSLIFVSFLIVITFIDYDHQLILDKVLIWFAGAGVLINWITGSLPLGNMVLAALLGGGLLLLVAVVSRGGMGGGDVKFAAALGLWLGWQLTLLALLLSFFLGGLGGAILMLLKIKGRKDFIPFGPFIALGAFISLLYGYRILAWYLANFLR